MKAITVTPGKPMSTELRDIPNPSLDDISGGRGVLVRVLRVGLDGQGAARGMDPHPLDADRARSRPDVPEQLPGQRREPGQGDCADVPLGQLTVIDEDLVRKPGDARQRTRAGTRSAEHGDGIEIGAAALVPPTAPH